MSKGKDRATANGPVLSHVSVGNLHGAPVRNGGRPRNVLLCEACHCLAWTSDSARACELLALLADCDVMTGLDPEASPTFSWRACDGCGAGEGLRVAYRARPVSQ